MIYHFIAAIDLFLCYFPFEVFAGTVHFEQITSNSIGFDHAYALRQLLVKLIGIWVHTVIIHAIRNLSTL